MKPFGPLATRRRHPPMTRILIAAWLALLALPELARAQTNPYFARSGEAPVTVYVATCATSGGFIHMYTALDQNLFGKYGISVRHVVIRTGTNINLAALAKSVKFVEDNPEKAKASVAKILRVQDEDVLQSSYEAYAKKHVNRRLIVPLNAVADSVDVARESGTKVSKKANELVDNSFADNLEKSGFLKELWGGKLPN